MRTAASRNYSSGRSLASEPIPWHADGVVQAEAANATVDAA
jgi:hypothetical protein